MNYQEFIDLKTQLETAESEFTQSLNPFMAVFKENVKQSTGYSCKRFSHFIEFTDKHITASFYDYINCESEDAFEFAFDFPPSILLDPPEAALVYAEEHTNNLKNEAEWRKQAAEKEYKEKRLREFESLRKELGL